MKLINNSVITNYLKQVSLFTGPTDIAEFVAGYIEERLRYDNSLNPMMLHALDMDIVLKLPYELTKRLFGDNFLGLLEGKGIDRSDMIKSFEARIAKNKGSNWGPHPWSVELDVDVYYGDPSCALVLKLYRVTVSTMIATSDPVLSTPDIHVRLKIVNMKDEENLK